MKTPSFRWQLTLAAMVLAMTVVQPAGAARLKTGSVARVAVFQVASTTKIVVGTDRAATLQNLNVGDRVSIAYDQENGALVAHHIADGVEHNAKRTGNLSTTTPSAEHHHTGTSTYKHTHGTVRSVDVQDGTLTIVYEEKI